MKTFKILGYIILGMILILLIGAFFLPKEVKISKTQVIEAPIDSVFNLVNDFHNWQRWSPWDDTSKIYTFNGSEMGLGAIMRWVDKEGQVGERTISNSEYPKNIQVVTLYRKEKSNAKMDFTFNADDSTAVEVTISFKMDTHFSYPFGRYIAWMLQAGLDVSFPKALVNLENSAEAQLIED